MNIYRVIISLFLNFLLSSFLYSGRNYINSSSLSKAQPSNTPSHTPPNKSSSNPSTNLSDADFSSNNIGNNAFASSSVLSLVNRNTSGLIALTSAIGGAGLVNHLKNKEIKSQDDIIQSKEKMIKRQRTEIGSLETHLLEPQGDFSYSKSKELYKFISQLNKETPSYKEEVTSLKKKIKNDLNDKFEELNNISKRIKASNEVQDHQKIKLGSRIAFLKNSAIGTYLVGYEKLVKDHGKSLGLPQNSPNSLNLALPENVKAHINSPDFEFVAHSKNSAEYIRSVQKKYRESLPPKRVNQENHISIKE